MPVVIVEASMKVNGEQRIFNWSYPSTIVKDYLRLGNYANQDEFLTKAIIAVKEADKRVIAKYGFECYGCVELLNELTALKNKKLENIEIKSFK